MEVGTLMGMVRSPDSGEQLSLGPINSGGELKLNFCRQFSHSASSQTPDKDNMAGKKRKRSLSGPEGDEDAPAVRVALESNASTHTNSRQPKTNHHKKPPPLKGKPRPKKRAVAPLKKRIRDLKRQLARSDNMPVSIRVEHERELASLEQERAITEAEIQKQEMTGKYHMVRFFGMC
jgi:hypothetical protein